MGEKWQSKTLFLAIFDPRSSIIKSVFDFHLPGVIMSGDTDTYRMRIGLHYCRRLKTTVCLELLIVLLC